MDGGWWGGLVRVQHAGCGDDADVRIWGRVVGFVVVVFVV